MRPAALLVALCTLASVGRADKGGVSLGVMPAYALSYVDGRKPSGGGVALDFGVGISEAFELIAVGMVGFHPVKATDSTSAGTLGAFSAGVGIRYTIDVIRLIPTFEATIGVLGIRGAPNFAMDGKAQNVIAPSTDAALGLGFQLHYLVKRYLAIGFTVRYQAQLTALDRIPVYLYLGPDLSFRFNN